jgi:hypothetical protein
LGAIMITSRSSRGSICAEVDVEAVREGERGALLDVRLDLLA